MQIAVVFATSVQLAGNSRNLRGAEHAYSHVLPDEFPIVPELAQDLTGVLVELDNIPDFELRQVNLAFCRQDFHSGPKKAPEGASVAFRLEGGRRSEYIGLRIVLDHA